MKYIWDVTFIKTYLFSRHVKYLSLIYYILPQSTISYRFISHFVLGISRLTIYCKLKYINEIFKLNHNKQLYFRAITIMCTADK